ncbi:MAG: peptide ABC transporter substrate-binding protein [Oscillospiraceae bacterium]|nr:peptide ABC transporter substrate-binding protein [Oscillospiraceae bacterium]
MKKRFCVLLAVLVLAMSLLGGCGDSTAGQVFRLDILSEPSSIDPQTASADEQYLILLNTMEGLFRMDETQTPVAAAAEDYAVSADGLTYTFNLREGMFWSDGETPVTAYDFQFAFRRLLDPQTQSAAASGFVCIRGAAAALSGEGAVQNIGVTARDAHTLVIQLESATPSFLSLLATPAALPCNEDFFTASRGKYGVSDEFMLFNGPFYIYNWTEGEYIHMRRNPHYYDEDAVIPAAFRLYIKETNDLSRLTSGAVDAAAVSFGELEQLGLDYGQAQFSNILWAILPNLDNPFLSNLSIRQALAAGMDRGELSGYLGENQNRSTAPVPPAVTLNGGSYREQAGDDDGLGDLPYAASELYQIGLKELAADSAPSLTLICPDTGGIPLLLSQLQRQWWDALGVFINIEPLEQSELASRIAAGDYDLALCAVKASYDSPEAVLSQLYGAGSLTGWQNDQMADYMAQAKSASTAAGVLFAYRAAERMLTENGIVLPLFYETSYYVTAPSVSGLQFSPFGCHVYFAGGRKKG